MSILNTNKLTFFKNEGKPLSLGYAYIGQPQLDPQVVSNQKTVTFTDSIGNSFTAPQPLRLDNDGRIQWNGKPIIASITGDYSLLLLDSNQTQINGGWTPLVSASDEEDENLNNYRRYENTLAELKQVDVSVGTTVGNLGKTNVGDGLGSVWRVVSSTGTPNDDIDFIGFSNGLQGIRVRGFMQGIDNLNGLSNLTESRNNISVYSKAESDSRYINDDTGTVVNGNIEIETITADKLNYQVNNFSAAIPANGLATFTMPSDYLFTPLFEEYDAANLDWYVFLVPGVSLTLNVKNNVAAVKSVSGKVISVAFS